MIKLFKIYEILDKTKYKKPYDHLIFYLNLRKTQGFPAQPLLKILHFLVDIVQAY